MRHFHVIGLAATLAATIAAQEFKLGAKVADFPLQSTTGETVQFDSLKGPVTVITFVSTECPVSNAYNERMASLYNEYGTKGVKFVFINSNSNEPAAKVAEHASKNFPFAVYKDDANTVADRFGATVTPEVFVMDKNGTVVYHGSIDDSQEPARVTQHRLKGALDSVLAGRTVATPESKAFGCTIKRVKKQS
ncbi:MAG TPA: redoxin domain-containing protein [Bryobacteraceae bacterium]|nr:redoxin domain-containing protein [Bryobacteraceae bacterium]